MEHYTGAMRRRNLARGLGMALLMAGAAAGQSIYPPAHPGPQLPAQKPGAQPSATANKLPPPKARSRSLSPTARANSLPGQQFRTAPRPNADFNPTESRHDLKVGNFYYNLGNYVGALSRYRAAFRHDPHNAQGLYRCGQAAKKMKLWQAARNYFQLYLKKFPRGRKWKAAGKQIRKLNRRLARFRKHQ